MPNADHHVVPVLPWNSKLTKLFFLKLTNGKHCWRDYRLSVRSHTLHSTCHPPKPWLVVGFCFNLFFFHTEAVYKMQLLLYDFYLTFCCSYLRWMCNSFIVKGCSFCICMKYAWFWVILMNCICESSTLLSSLIAVGWFSIKYSDYTEVLASSPTLIFTGHSYMPVSSAMLVSERKYSIVHNESPTFLLLSSGLFTGQTISWQHIFF